MLHVGGEWVAPAEVEATIIEHPSVLEVAIVGMVDDGHHASRCVRRREGGYVVVSNR